MKTNEEKKTCGSDSNNFEEKASGIEKVSVCCCSCTRCLFFCLRVFVTCSGQVTSAQQQSKSYRDCVWERRDDEPLTHSANFRSSSTSPPPARTTTTSPSFTSHRNHTLNSNRRTRRAI